MDNDTPCIFVLVVSGEMYCSIECHEVDAKRSHSEKFGIWKITRCNAITAWFFGRGDFSIGLLLCMSSSCLIDFLCVASLYKEHPLVQFKYFALQQFDGFILAAKLISFLANRVIERVENLHQSQQHLSMTKSSLLQNEVRSVLLRWEEWFLMALFPLCKCCRFQRTPPKLVCFRPLQLWRRRFLLFVSALKNCGSVLRFVNWDPPPY